MSGPEVIVALFVGGMFIVGILFSMLSQPAVAEVPVLTVKETAPKSKPKAKKVKEAEKYNKEDFNSAKQVLQEFGYSATDAKKLLMTALVDNPSNVDDWVNKALRKVEL